MSRHVSRRQIGLHGVVICALFLGLLSNAVPISAARPIESQSNGPSALSTGAQPASARPDRATSPVNPAASNAGGPAMFLNGGNYVSIPDASLPAIGSNDFTLEAWVYPINTTGCHAVFGKDYLSGFWFGLCNGHLRFQRGSASYLDSVLTVPLNQWTHIAVSSHTDYDCNPTNGYCTDFYINGDLDSDQAQTGAAAVGGTRDLRLGDDQTWDYFNGDIAEARMWLGGVDGLFLRRNMHHALTEKRPGLIANWHLTGDFKDAINGRDGTPIGSPAFVGFPSPAQPDVSVTDRFFNTLPVATYAAGTAFVPSLNRAILAGGYRAGMPSAAITSVDAGSGAATDIGSLPLPRAYPAAAYATANDTVYVFGGSDQLATAEAFDSIYAIDPHTGAARTVAANLPAGRDNAAAVYLNHLNKIVIFGGWYYAAGVEQVARDVYVFDVATESISTASFTLLQPGYGLAAAYSPLTQKVYFFGGSPDAGATFDNGAYQLTLNADNSGSITKLAAQLPQGDQGAGAVEDPITHLIYLINGQFNGNVIAFDPVTLELWRTLIELPRDDAGNLLIRPYSSVVYSARARQALVIGGGSWNTSGDNNVWRIPLGSGPSVPVGNWDFTYSRVGNLDYMSSVSGRVAMGRADGVVRYFNADKTVQSPPALGATNLSSLVLNPSDGSTWFSLYGATAVTITQDPGTGALTTIYTDTRPGGVTTLDAPGAVMPYGSIPFFGDGLNLKWRTFANQLFNTWSSNFIAPNTGTWQNTHITAITHRADGDAWALVEPWHNQLCAPNSPNTAADASRPNCGPTPGRALLGRLTYNYVASTASEAYYGNPCGASLAANDMALGLNGDWWIGGVGGVCRYSNAYPPNLGYGGNLFVPTTGVNVVKLSVDGDGRIWAALRPDSNGNGGGLSAYEVLNGASALGSVRTQDWNWLTAPIGTKTALANGYDSGIRALTANGERVWLALDTDPLNGPLAMYAPRWQQLTSANEGNLGGVRRVFLVRGRAFLATTNNRLVTLQPDGITWDDRALAGVNAVTADQQGRIWIGASDGVRRWTPSGWDMIDGALGTPPAGPINAIAADSQGRLWIGGENGLTLFDRERWVATLQPPQGAISVTAVLVDRDDNVWAGTTQGLAKLNMADQTWTTYTTADGLYTNSIFNLQSLGDGQLAVSTSGAGGGLSLFDGKTFTPQPYPTGADQPLTADNLGRLWAGAVNREPSGYYGRFWTNSGLIDSQVVANASDGANLVWFAHPSGGVSIRSAFLPPLADVQPQINPANGIVPNYGSEGNLVTINGSGFGDNPAEVDVIIGGAPVEIYTISDTQIVAQLGSNNLTGDVTVRRGKRSATLSGGATPAFCAKPKLTSATPTGGNVGVDVTVKGSNFDAQATYTVGSGPVRDPYWISSHELHFNIKPGDTTGTLQINNRCAGEVVTAAGEFRVIGLGIDRVVLNQGLPSYQLIALRPTLVENFLTRSIDPRPADRFEFDSIELQITDLTTHLSTYRTVPYSGTFPTTRGAPSAVLLQDVVNSVNVPNVFLDTSGTGGGVAVTTILREHGYTVAQNSTTAHLGGNEPLRVLFVPVMHPGFTSSDLDTMKANVTKDLGPLTYRLMPQGMVQWVWSDSVLTRDSADIGNTLQLYETGHAMDDIRKNWNKTHGASLPVVVAFGVVDGQIASSNKDGLAFWPDLSSLLNQTALVPFQALCDLASTAANVISFGLVNSKCSVDIPLFVGWARGDRATSSALFAHELGHISELVKPDAYDGSWVDNFSHSVNDEISDGECGTGSQYTWNRTLYAQPGVQEPVVDPITGLQYRPHPADGKTADDQYFGRGKSVMSYACAKTSSNSFFEPVDYNTVRAPVNAYFALNSSPLAQQAAAGLRGNAPMTSTLPGPRLFVSGAITPANNTANFVNVERPAGEPPLSPAFMTGYDLVQRDSQGAELARLGVYPIFASTDAQGTPANTPATTTNDLGFFSATVLRATGVVTLELQHNGVALAQFHAGSAVPAITLTSPTAGAYAASVPVTWSASDADGDPLTISIEYARDGSQWQPVGRGAGSSGTITVPAFLLGGSTTAQVRAYASDGFNVGVFTSTQFSVPNQPPLPIISQPQTGATFLEGQTLDLAGSALDRQDGTITDTQLLWSSSRDGRLGSGSDLVKILSVGVHTLTLQATNSAGLSATTSVTISVLADYVMDGIPDSQKFANGWNPLDDKLAYSDPTGSGIPLIMQLKRGRLITDTFPPDRLIVAPAVLTFTADLTAAVPFPQQPVVVASRLPVSWTMSTAAAWLTASSTSGQTPEGVTIEALPYRLSNGQYTGVINFSSPQLTNTVAVTINLTVINAGRNCDVNRDGVSNATDVQLVQSAIGTNYTQPDFNLRYDLNRDGSVAQADVSLAQACVAMATGHKVYLPLVRR